MPSAIVRVPFLHVLPPRAPQFADPDRGCKRGASRVAQIFFLPAVRRDDIDSGANVIRRSAIELSEVTLR